MKHIIKRIEHFGVARELVFAAVQLSHPHLRPDTARGTLEWQPDERSTRIEEARRVLERLLAGEASKKPDVIVFSEYSLPPEAHKEIHFQKLSDEHGCIIIAGTYFNADRSTDHFRHNICNIYLPCDETSPLVISKLNAATEEKPYLRVSDTESPGSPPNIARLVWALPDREPVTMNIFICRDYLVPFRERAAVDAELHGGKSDRVSLLDWDHEGINIVIMRNDDPALFEGAAAFDVRRIHGKRKLVLFVNSTNDHGRLATALLGASNSKKRERDVAAKIPPSEHGVLIVETTLWEIVARKEDPDTEYSFPIKHWECYGFVSGDDFRLSKLRKPDTPARKRGIFHPVFLGAMQKWIVIELFVARSTQKIEKAFSEGKIDFVSASHVRGIEDVIIRRYVESHTLMAKRAIPSISQPASLPYSRMSAADFTAAFDTERQTAHVRILIDPRGIRKFRGERVDVLSDADWISRCAEITAATHRREALEQIISIATELPPDGEIPRRFASVFSLGVEDVIEVGPETQIRDTYLLISTEASDDSLATERFLDDFLNVHLMDDPRVRDIYLFENPDFNPPIRRNSFRFLLRLKCTIFEADDILSLIQAWAGRTGVRVGTRSYDAWKTFKRAATNGIVETTMTQDEGTLQKALFAIDPEFSFESREVQEKFAESIRIYVRAIKIISSDDWTDIEAELTQFLNYVCVYNCVKAPARRRKYKEEAATFWNRLFKRLEDSSSSLLCRALELPENASRSDIVDKLKIHAPAYFNDGRSRDAGPLKLFADLYDKIRPAAAGLTKLVRQSSPLVAPFRNVAVHGGVGQDLDHAITISGQRWRSQFDALESRVGAMCKLHVEFALQLEGKAEKP